MLGQGLQFYYTYWMIKKHIEDMNCIWYVCFDTGTIYLVSFLEYTNSQSLPDVLCRVSMFLTHNTELKKRFITI